MSTERLSPTPASGSQTPTGMTRSGKLIRLTSVAHAMLEEARDAPCDPAGCERLRAIYLRTIEQLHGLLSAELRDELSHLVVPFENPAPTPSELRVAQAELVGWLEGLLTGIASSIAVHEQQARTRADAVGETMPGQYL